MEGMPNGVIFLLLIVGFAGFAVISGNHDAQTGHDLLSKHFGVQQAWGHDGDGDGIDDDTLLPVVDEASSDPFSGSASDFEAVLNHTNIVGPNTSNSTGLAAQVHMLWSENQERLQYEIKFTNSTHNLYLDGTQEPGGQTVTKIHIHVGNSSVNGFHALNIFGQPAQDDAEMRVHQDHLEVHGVWGEIDTGSLTSDMARSRQLSDMRDELCSGNLYFQVHTNWSDARGAAGAIRGQIEPTSELCEYDLSKNEFAATLNAAQVIAAGGASSQAATGAAELHFNSNQTGLYYRIEFTGIDIDGTQTPSVSADDLVALHIHRGAAGHTGGHALNIFGAPCTITDSPFNATCDDAQMDFDAASGVISGVYDDTDRSTSFSEAGRSKFLSDMTGQLCDDQLYFQAHTGGGNIRGQIELQNHDICDFDPNHDDFTATLDGSQIVGGTGSSATGTAEFRFNTHGDELQYSIDLDGIDTDDRQTLATADDDLTAMHLHNAASGRNSHVHMINIFGFPAFDDDDFKLTPGTGTIQGIWDDGDESFSPSESGRTKKLTSSMEEICDGRAYINVHTNAFGSGAIRGQITPTPDNIACDFDLSEHDFVAEINGTNIETAGLSPTGAPSTATAYGEFFYNHDRTKLHYVLELSGIDTTSQQTLDTADDDLTKIHLHFGKANGTAPDDGSPNNTHAYNIISPWGDQNNLKIDNGTTTVSGIWDSSDPTGHHGHDSKPLTYQHDNLCDESLYVQIHLSSGNIRGQIVPDEHSTACDAPSLISATLVGPTTVTLVFENPVNGTSLKAADFSITELNGTSISSVSAATNTNGNGVVTLTLDSAVDSKYVSDGSMNILSSLTSDIGINFETSENPVTIRNALPGVPVELTADVSDIVLSDGSTLDAITIDQHTADPTLDFTLMSTTDTTTSPGKTTIMFPNAISATSTSASGLTSTVEFPSGLTVTGSTTSFDGVLEMPSFSDSCPTVAGPTKDCISLGSSDGELTFSSPVKITLEKKAGTIPFYQSPGKSPAQITAACDDADTPAVGATALSSGGTTECFSDSQGDLVIWTLHATTFGGSSPVSSSGSGGGGGGRVTGGGGQITSVLASNLISYNICDPNLDGLVRVLTFNSPIIDSIGLNVYAGDYMSYGVNVTDSILPSAYLDKISSDYVYTVFDAKIPAGTEKFFVTVFDRDDMGAASPILVDTKGAKCADSLFPHDLRDTDVIFLPIEPIDQTSSLASVEELTIEHKPDSIQFDYGVQSDPLSENGHDAKTPIISTSQPTAEGQVETTGNSQPINQEPNEDTKESPPVVEETSDALREPQPIAQEPVETAGESQPAVQEPVAILRESQPKVYGECGVGTALIDGVCLVYAEKDTINSQCGPGTTFVNGMCRVSIGEESETKIIEPTAGNFFDQVMYWLGFP